MSQEKTMLLLLKGHITELEPEQQVAIKEIYENLKLIVDGSAESLIALSLLSAEIAVEQA